MAITLPLFPWSKTNLLTSRSSRNSTIAIQQTVLDLYLVGYPAHANALLDSLLEHAKCIIFDLHEWKTAFALYYAWDATEWTPEYIAHPDLDLIIDGRETASDRFEDRWKKMRDSWVDGLPNKAWGDEVLGGNIGPEDVKWALAHFSGEVNDGKKRPLFSIGMVVQIMMLAGEEEEARRIMVENVAYVYERVRERCDTLDGDMAELRDWTRNYLGLHSAPQMWKMIPSQELQEKLDVKEEEVEAFVQEGCDLIKQRFTNGPLRPYADKSTAELLHIMDENYIAARKANPEAHEYMSVAHLNTWPDSPTTFLAPGATNDQLAALQDKLAESFKPRYQYDDSPPTPPETYLPEDYTAFLRTSNGFQVTPADSTGILCSVHEVGDTDVEFLCDMEWQLFPEEYLHPLVIDYIGLSDFKSFSIGADGIVVLIPPSSVRPVVEEFLKFYDSANERDRRICELAAGDLYGGMERVRGLEWLCVVYEEWGCEQKIWGSFREYLEECAVEAGERRRKDEREASKWAEAEAEAVAVAQVVSDQGTR